MSLRKRFGLEADEYTGATRIIILKLKDQSMIGVIVDEVKEVVNLDPETIEKPNFKLDESNASYLTGIGKSGENLISLLGSCLGVILYDQRLKICGLAHVMMPSSQLIRKNANRMKFVDTCLKDMFEELLKQGSRKENMIAKMAGGAQMFVNQNAHNMLNIGQQNIQAVHELLAEWKIPLVAEDVGNNYGRTIEFDPATGELMIRTIGVGDTVI